MRALPASSERSVLLCTDLHPENALAARRERWSMIDPKPYVGDQPRPGAAHAQFPARLGTDPTGFARRMAGLLDLDEQRLRQWLFNRCVQESVRHPHLRGVATALSP